MIVLPSLMTGFIMITKYMVIIPEPALISLEIAILIMDMLSHPLLFIPKVQEIALGKKMIQTLSEVKRAESQ